MFFCAVCISFLICWNENLLQKHPVWSKCHFLVIPSSPSLFDEKLSSSNGCVTLDLSIFLEPLVSSSGWKSTTTEQLLLEKPAWAVRKCHWLPEPCFLFSLCPWVVAEEVVSGRWEPQGWWRCFEKDVEVCFGRKGWAGQSGDSGWAGCRRELCPPPGLQLGATKGLVRSESSQPCPPSSATPRIYLLMQT